MLEYFIGSFYLIIQGMSTKKCKKLKQFDVTPRLIANSAQCGLLSVVFISNFFRKTTDSRPLGIFTVLTRLGAPVTSQ
jgi:hypothetical protein